MNNIYDISAFRLFVFDTYVPLIKKIPLRFTLNPCKNRIQIFLGYEAAFANTGFINLSSSQDPMIPCLSKYQTGKAKSYLQTADVIGKGLAACAVLLLLISSAWWNVPVTQPIQLPKPQSKTVKDLPPSLKPDLAWWETRRFYHHIETRLPLYQQQFERVAQAYGISWTLLAAQAYQESRWDRYAVSPTGVRGIMMLTRNTASSLGIQNRLDPTKSIEGGARYFWKLEKRLPTHIGKPDRIWIALAAYNVGIGHIKDAQYLALHKGKNPNSWKDLKTVLPLLAKKTYYKSLRYGYARGWEPVQYVKRIRAYHALLEQYLREI